MVPSRFLALAALALVLAAPARAQAPDPFAGAALGSSPLPARGLPGAHVLVTGGYARALSFSDSTESAAGPVLQARLHAPVVGGLGVSARVGLDYLGVQQEDAIPRWDWGYWEELWRTWSTIYRDRADMDAAFRPVQHALLVGGSVAPSFTAGSARRSVTVWAGPSLTYYTRRLYNEEAWTREYPSIEHTFSYTIRNYAPDKTGLALGVDAGLTGRYPLLSWLDISAGATYRRLQMQTTSELPLNDIVTLDLGFAVRY